jgi:aryl-alcohol dehydrogenase-like predicted oxidoreductase
MEMRQLGTNGPLVSALGLGCMGMSGMYGAAEREASVATIHAALNGGINLLDTGDFYGTGHNEMLIGEAIRQRLREQVVISVKFGSLRDPAGGWTGFDGRPQAVKNFLAYTLQRLGTSYVDIYRPSRVDPQVPIEETIGAIAEMVKAGYVRHIGLSEASAATLRRAHAVHPICDLQIEYSLFSRGIEREILPACQELGVGITAYGVLSRGLLSGHWSKDRQGRDFRAALPRFQGENLDRNLELVEAIRSLAAAKGTTVAQLATAWVLARSSNIVALAGSRRIDQLEEILGAFSVTLSAADLQELERLVPASAVAGERYHAHGMLTLDSER